METTMFFGLITTSHPIEVAYTIGALAIAVAILVINTIAVVIEELVVRTKVGQWLTAKLFQLKQLAS